MTDIIIVGGGPAGMTAALYARRAGKSVLIIEKQGFGGQITYSPKVENLPGTTSISGNEFADNMLSQIMDHGAEVEFAEVTEVTKCDNIFSVYTEDGTSFESKAVILALGVKHRMLGLEGEKELVGDGISFCAVCDGDFYTDKTVIVAGGGNSALQEAILLSAKCKRVIIIQDLPYLTGDAVLCDTLTTRENVDIQTGKRITGILTKGNAFSGITVKDKETTETSSVSADGMFVAIGLIPENIKFENVADLDTRGYFASSENCLTKTPGLFAAGDCRAKSIRQVTTACADGAVAALAACTYIDSL